MGLHSTEAFVLRTYSLAEADKICVFLTRDAGKVRGVAYGARKMKSRFGSALEPFTEVALTYYQKESRELVSVSTCEIVRSHFNRAAQDVETAGAFSYMAELVTEFVPDHEPNEHLYRLIAASLETIESGGELSPALRYFESWMLRLGGFFPELELCAVCDQQIDAESTTYLSLDGAPHCFDCSQGRGARVVPGVRDTFKEMLRVHPSAFANKSVDADTLERVGEINYQLIRHALERDLRSRKLLTRLNAS